MISEIDIKTGLQRLLATLAGVPTIVWPNKAISPKAPYTIVDMMPTWRDARALGGDVVISKGFMVASVVWPANEFSTGADLVVQDILDLFYPTREIIVTSGKVIIETSSALMGYNDGVYWRSPARVDYYAF